MLRTRLCHFAAAKSPSFIPHRRHARDGQRGLTESFLGLPSTVTYTYDPAGNRATLKLNGQLHVSYDYDDAGRLWHIYRGSKVFTFGYDGASRRTSLSYPNGVVTTYGYDTLSRLTNVTTKLGTTVIAASTYTHDDAGNRLTKTTESYSESYDYDPTYRLDTVTRDFVLTEDYGYDAVGNRLSSLNYPTWTYNDRNELQSFNGTSYTYDLNGNRVGKTDPSGSWTYGWNWEGQLLSVFPPTGAVAFRYETLGRRVWKNAGATNQRAYTYDGEDILRETNWVTGATLTFIHGPGIDEPLAAEDQNGNFFYAHADGLGSVVKSTNANGQVITTKQYDAFGNIQIGASDGRYAFTGREWDPETGLYYYRARYYDQVAGRFLSEDPIGFLGGVNFYTYVMNNPVNFVDPSGLYCVFQQTTGRMTCYPWCVEKVESSRACQEPGPDAYYNEQGYSGKGPGQNNPWWQDVRDVGVIPRGLWRIVGEPYNREGGTGPDTMRLLPAPGLKCPETRQCVNPDTFRIHGDTDWSSWDKSTGCIVLPSNRTRIPSGETIFVVE